LLYNCKGFSYLSVQTTQKGLVIPYNKSVVVMFFYSSPTPPSERAAVGPRNLS
jgi:hypothetical protein